MTYPWEDASTAHLIYRMSDAELLALIVEACATPRSTYYLDHMRIVTQHRRERMRMEDLFASIAVIFRAERAAGRC